MSLLLTNLLLFFFGLTIVTSTVLDLILVRKVKSFLFTVGGVLVFGLILHLTVGFPKARYDFGSGDEVLAVGIMLLAVLVGMIANQVYYSKGPLVLRQCAKPLVVSPIVLLPLLGSVQGANLDTLQFVCFAILAFQNGFFWQRVLAVANPTTT